MRGQDMSVQGIDVARSAEGMVLCLPIMPLGAGIDQLGGM